MGNGCSVAQKLPALSLSHGFFCFSFKKLLDLSKCPSSPFTYAFGETESSEAFLRGLQKVCSVVIRKPREQRGKVGFCPRRARLATQKPRALLELHGEHVVAASMRTRSQELPLLPGARSVQGFGKSCPVSWTNREAAAHRG